MYLLKITFENKNTRSKENEGTDNAKALYVIKESDRTQKQIKDILMQ